MFICIERLRSSLNWKKLQFLMSNKRQVLVADEYYDKSMIRKLLKTWRRYVEHKLFSRKMMYKGKFFYTMKLKQKVFNNLSRYVRFSNNRKIAIQKLKLFYRRLLILTVWNKLIESIDDKNDRELRDKLSLARSFYKKNISRKCLRYLKFYKIIKQRRKILKIKVIDMCDGYYFKKFLTRWQTAYSYRLRDLLSEEKALKLYNQSLIQKAILKWIEYHNYKISMKAKYEKSILHYENKISNKCFLSWINFCNEKIRKQNLIIEAREYHLEMLKRKILNMLSMNIVRKKLKQQKIEIADNYCKANLMIKIFSNWRKSSLNSKELKKKLSKYNKNWQNKLTLKIIREWKLYVVRKKLIFEKKLISVKHYRIKTCSKMFNRLRNYSIYKREKYCRLNYLNDGIERIKFNVKRMYCEKWRVAKSNLFKEKCKLFYADQFYVSNLNKKYIYLWKTYLIQHKMKRQYQNHINEMANNLILKKCLNIWYTMYKISLETYLNEMWASKIYEMKIKHKHFIAWRYLIEVLTRDKKLINNSKEVRKKLVIKEGLQHLIKLFLSNEDKKSENKYLKKNLTVELKLLNKYFNIWRKTVSLIIKKVPNDIEHKISKKLFINNDKHVSDATPHFMIPEFMKDEIKLHRGVGCCLSKLPINLNRIKICNNYLSEKSIINNEERKYLYDQSIQYQLKINNQSNNDEDRFSSNNSTTYNNNKTKITHDNKKHSSPHTRPITPLLSPDSIKSDLDSCKTYTVKNPVYITTSSESNSLNDKLFEEKEFATVNSLKQLPSAALCVALKTNDSLNEKKMSTYIHETLAKC